MQIAIETYRQAVAAEIAMMDAYLAGRVAEHDYTVSMGSVNIARQHLISLGMNEHDIGTL